MVERARKDAKDDRREDKAEESHRPDALLLHEIIRAEGVEELRRSGVALALSGFAAGLTMGFSLIVPGVLKAHLPTDAWAELVSSFGYSVGFVIVVLGRQQLFTENTVTPILPLLEHRDARTFWAVVRLWSIVLAANIAATYLIASALAHSDAFEPQVRTAFTELSKHAIESAPGTTFVKAIFAGWMIALMVWILPATGSAAPFVIMLMTWLVAMCGLSHIVAGSVDAFYLFATGDVDLAQYVTHFFLPTLTGNVLGGVALVSVLNYGQVAPEVEEG